MPFNLDDLEPDARALAEAAAKAAGLSLAEWINRFVLARAPETRPAQPDASEAPASVAEAPVRVPEHEPAAPAGPAPAGDTHEKAVPSTESEEKDGAFGDDAEQAESAREAPPDAPDAMADASPPLRESSESSGEPPLHDSAPPAGVTPGAILPSHHEPSPTVPVASEPAALAYSHAALSVVVARGSHSPLSVGADATTVIASMPPAVTRSAMDDATASPERTSPTEEAISAELAASEPPMGADDHVQAEAHDASGEPDTSRAAEWPYPASGDDVPRLAAAGDMTHALTGPPVAHDGAIAPAATADTQSGDTTSELRTEPVADDGDHGTSDGTILSPNGEASRSWAEIAAERQPSEPSVAADVPVSRDDLRPWATPETTTPPVEPPVANEAAIAPAAAADAQSGETMPGPDTAPPIDDGDDREAIDGTARPPDGGESRSWADIATERPPHPASYAAETPYRVNAADEAANAATDVDDATLELTEADLAPTPASELSAWPRTETRDEPEPETAITAIASSAAAAQVETSAFERAPPPVAEPTVPPAQPSERRPDLSHLFVETGGHEDMASRSNHLALFLGCAVLSIVAVAAWFYLSPTLDLESGSSPKLPPRTSVLKAPADSAPVRDSLAPPPELDAASSASADGPALANGAPTLAALKEGAEAGNGTAQHDLAVRYARGDGVERDYREAARWFRAAALQGIANAQYNIGVLTERGLGVDQNLPMALLWYLAAAGKGHSAAEYNVGLVYAEGKGVEADPAEAMKWFRRAAERGFAKAQYNMGVMYERGAADSAGLIEAYRWYRLAAAGGDREAEQRLGEIRSRMGRADIDRGEELARQPLAPPSAEASPSASDTKKP